MRVLFDKNVPYGTRNFLSNHRVETVDDHGWSRISNGELLKAAEIAGFDVVLTADQNIVYQQSFGWTESRFGRFRIQTSGQSYAPMKQRLENEWTRRFLEVIRSSKCCFRPKNLFVK